MADEVQFIPDSNQTSTESGSVDFKPDFDYEKESRYGTPSEMAKTALEGIGQGIAGPLATKAETALGVNPEDIVARQQTNPLTHGAGEVAGLIGGGELLPEASLAGILGKAGAATVQKLGLTGAKAIAAKVGVENALYSLQDEVSKYIVNDPNSVQAAAMHVGLSGLLGVVGGAALGKVSDLWAAKYGPKADEFINDFANKMGEKSAPVVEYKIRKGPFGNWPPAPEESLFEKVIHEPEVSPGEKAADKITDAAIKASEEAISAGAGAAIGHATGIPGAGLLGAFIGRNTLKPVLRTFLPTLIKPLLETIPSAQGFKAASDTINAISRGDSLLSKSAKEMFTVGSKSLSQLVPDDHKLDRLKDKLADINKNPGQLMDVGGQLGHYLPDHQTALAQTVSNIANLLNSAQPRQIRPGVLNKSVEPSTAKLSDFNRTMQIAEQPLSVLHFAKQGSLRPKDVNTLDNLYPTLKAKIIDKVNQEMINHISRGNHVPFRLRRGLSILMGQPMDSNFSPTSIQSMQASYIPLNSPQMPQGSPRAKKSTAKVGESAKMARTPDIARQEALLKA